MGDSVRGSSDSMGNATNGEQESSSVTAAADAAASEDAAATSEDVAAATVSPRSTSSASPFVSLVDRAFGGKIRTTYTCGKCSTVSMHKETFTVLHLAIPEEGKSEKVLENHVLHSFSYFLLCPKARLLM